MKIDMALSPHPHDLEQLRLGIAHYNVTQVPQLLDLMKINFAVVMIENDRIVAGSLCEIDWGWLYFDTVWTHESVRGKGYGTLIMQAAESYAYQKGIDSAYLFTTSFQARPFYEKLGYETFGDVDNHPNGHHFYYLRKYQLAQIAIDPRITIQEPPIQASSNILENGLLDTIAQTAPLHVRKITLLLRDDGEIMGGCVGSQFWDWFDLHILWISDPLQGQGWGSKLLHALENEVKQRQLNGILCDTTSFQALPFYQARGFEIVGSLSNRPPNHKTTFLKKSL